MGTFTGNSANNTFHGTSGGDSMFGNGGNDTLYGNGGIDYLHGGSGIDKLYGGDGNDKMNSTTGAVNFSSTGQSYEILDGGAGSDNAHIDAKGSTIDGYAVDAVNVSSNGSGYWVGAYAGELGEGVTLANVKAESFTFVADGPAVRFIGNIGGTGPTASFTLTDKDDSFCGGGEKSYVNMGAGNDEAIISAGNDVFWLGTGTDTVRFSGLYNGPRSGAVQDFNKDEDVLDLSGWEGKGLTVTEDASGTWLKAGDDSLQLVGVFDFTPDFIA